MSFINNEEIRLPALLMLVVSASLTVAGFVVSNTAGILVLLACLVLCAIFFIVTKKRYDAISALSSRVDRVLHGEEELDFQSFSEGELSILEGDIQKMTVRLREQAEALKRDKAFLADGMADISHQIRTPLTSIRILTALLAKPEVQAEERIEFTREMETMVGRIDWLLTTLLKMSKIDAGTAYFEKQRISLNKLIDKSIEPLEIPLDIKDISVKVECAKDVIVDLDHNWTAEALGNIIKNSMEHAPRGGTITINCSQNNLFTLIKICDNGKGIAKEDLPHLFERFYQGTHTKSGSFGVGLALSRMIMSAQNATIKAENSPTRGACFTIKVYHSNM